MSSLGAWVPKLFVRISVVSGGAVFGQEWNVASREQIATSAKLHIQSKFAPSLPLSMKFLDSV